MHRIELAEKEDLPKVTHLVEKGINELPIRTYDVDRSTLADSVYKSWLVAPCFKVVKDGIIIGCASLDLGSYPWNKKPYLTSNMVYVLPEHRSSGIIKELYKAITKFAKLQGILYVDNFVSDADKIDGRARLARLNKLDIAGISILFDGEVQ